MPQATDIREQIHRAGRLARLFGWSVALACFFGLLSLLVRLLPAGECSIDLAGVASVGARSAGPFVGLSRSVLYGPFFSFVAGVLAGLCGLSRPFQKSCWMRKPHRCGCLAPFRTSPT